MIDYEEGLVRCHLLFIISHRTYNVVNVGLVSNVLLSKHTSLKSFLLVPINVVKRIGNGLNL